MGARPPKSTTPLNWSKVDKFIVHYSGASRLQTVRSIQNFCMDNKDHSDIDYNELVRGNVLYEGRGNNVGSHTLGNNSTSYGVCMIGVDGDATTDDYNVIRSRYDYACQRAGRTLRMLGHNQAPGLPAGYTSCPGSQLQRWINDGMPYLEEDMAVETEWSEANPLGPDPDGHVRSPLQHERDVFAAVVLGKPPVGHDGQPVGDEAWIVTKLKEIEADVSNIVAPVIDYDLLATKIAEKLAPQLPVPATPAEIADAVVEEIAS